MSKGVNLLYDGYQVVEGKFFAHVNMPSATIKNGKFIFNKAFVREMGDATHLQILLNVEKKKLVIKPCGEDDKSAFRWQEQSGKTNRVIALNKLFISIYSALGWSDKFSYKGLAQAEQNESGRYFVFDLNNVEIYVPQSLINEKAAEAETEDAT